MKRLITLDLMIVLAGLVQMPPLVAAPTNAGRNESSSQTVLPAAPVAGLRGAHWSAEDSHLSPGRPRLLVADREAGDVCKIKDLGSHCVTLRHCVKIW
jgi:hypothetical protein